MSPRLRADLVVNNLVGFAYLQGEVLLKSDGSPWRPLVHVQDVSRVFLACLEAPRDVIHNQSFNVGHTSRELSDPRRGRDREDVVPGSRVVFAEGAGRRHSRLPGRLRQARQGLPHAVPQWTVQRGVEELYAAYRRMGSRLTSSWAASCGSRISRDFSPRADWTTAFNGPGREAVRPRRGDQDVLLRLAPVDEWSERVRAPMTGPP